MFKCSDLETCPSPTTLSQTGLDWTVMSTQDPTFDSQSAILPGSIVEASVLEFVCGVKIKKAIEAKAIMCNQDNWNTQSEQDFGTTSSDFASTHEELKCNEGYYVSGIQTKRQEERFDPRYYLAVNEMSFSVTTSATTLADPTLDGSSCLENDSPTDPLWV